jgi:hypothetical protein
MSSCIGPFVVESKLQALQERRTWCAFYRAYYRVIAFHVLWFHLLIGLAFANDQKAGASKDSFKGRWWVGMSAVVITHAVLAMAYFFAGVFVKARIPNPPAASKGLHRRVEGGSFMNYVSWCVLRAACSKLYFCPVWVWQCHRHGEVVKELLRSGAAIDQVREVAAHVLTRGCTQDKSCRAVTDDSVAQALLHLLHPLRRAQALADARREGAVRAPLVRRARRPQHVGHEAATHVDRLRRAARGLDLSLHRPVLVVPVAQGRPDKASRAADAHQRQDAA